MTTTTDQVVKDAIAETYRTTISFEEKVNDFLDGLISVRDSIQKVNDEWRNVNGLTQKYISECHSKNDLTVLLLTIKSLILTGDSTLKKMCDSGLSQNIQSVVEDFKDNLDHTKEIHSDIEIKISDDQELTAIKETLKNLGF